MSIEGQITVAVDERVLRAIVISKRQAELIMTMVGKALHDDAFDLDIADLDSIQRSAHQTWKYHIKDETK